MRSKSGSSANPHRSTDGLKANGGNLRDKATINRLNMYKAKGIRDKKGKLVGGAYMMKNRSGDQAITAETGRVAPDRRWFGNTRVIKQEELDKFREEMSTRSTDPYSVVLRRKKLPMGLLQEPDKVSRMNLLETESYSDVLANGRRRKRPKLGGGVNDLSTLLASAEVLDCSDVVIQVLDARNVPGTRCPHLERHLKKNASHKHLIFVINKVDLVPTWVTKKWVKLLSATHPTLAFHASITNSFGKGALINLLRQFAKLHPDKKQISVGVVGYPNVGKSSIINTLKKKKVCKVAPVPGETKVWQYIALMRRIFIVDCPGVVYDDGDDEIEIVLKGVVRAEKLPDPTDFVPAILSRVKEEYVRRLYGVAAWEDATDFMTKLAARSGRLLAGGEPDFHSVAVNIINDYQRGKLPYFVAPPLAEGETPKSVAAEPTVKASFDVDAMTATKAIAAAAAALEDEEEEEGGKGKGKAGDSVGGKKKKKNGKKMSRKEEEAEEDLAAVEAEEAARLARFEAEDDDDDDDDDSDGDEVGVTEKSTPASAGGGAAAVASSKKRKAPLPVAEAVDEGVARKRAARGARSKAEEKEKPSGGKGVGAKKASKRRAADMEEEEEECGGKRGGGKKKKGRGASKAVVAREKEEEEEEDVAEDDDGAMPSIGEGLAWDDLS
ncbi:Ngp1, nucleolar GTPase [Ectocarpus siliculosus]|uniref:Nucleolar GTP-binding protein 2 n=1 Tax=Ectocarpus siliculosus TaxID=2880 RepID=D8LTC1_ECTSI|nr:Ngp1, nucleolar GTPase [Ectocarpus siliculosus]|eukprot:CBN77992.1 Ngp1, nucleolar GTPase [Ectocarpus siliculosus]